MEVKPGYKQTELGLIPENWEVPSIGTIASFKSGDGINVAALREQSSDTPVPVYGGNGIAGYTARALVQQRVVVVGRVGQKCGEVYLTNGPAWITDNALYPRTFLRKIDVRLLALALKGAGLNSVKNRNDLPLITQSILHSVRIALPPTEAEQEAIANALNDADALIDSLEKFLVKKRQLKQGTMQELLTGKKRLPGFSGAWSEAPLGCVADLLKGSGLSRAKVSASGTRPCILYGELFTTYGRVITRTVSRTDADEGLLSVSGDVLMPGSTTTTGIDLATASALLVDNVALGGDINVIRRKSDNLDSTFFANFVTHARRNAIAEIAQGITIHHLYGRDLRRLAVQLPSLPEQTAIAAILSDMDAEIVALDKKLTKVRQLKQGMTQDLLTGKIRLV